MTNNQKENKNYSVEQLIKDVIDGKIISDIEMQREIVYDSEKQEKVIDSLVKGIPLPAFYLWKREDGKLEVLDGKQRIESVKKFKCNELTYKNRIWKDYGQDSTNNNVQDIINQTIWLVFECSGDENYKREIFNRINTLGVPLSTFEIINGLYNGVFIQNLKQVCLDDENLKSILPKEKSTIDRGKIPLWILKKNFWENHLARSWRWN
ncbi:DUF262 domain-containing protein [Mycoplasma sp. 4044]